MSPSGRVPKCRTGPSVSRHGTRPPASTLPVDPLVPPQGEVRQSQPTSKNTHQERRDTREDFFRPHGRSHVSILPPPTPKYVEIEIQRLSQTFGVQSQFFTASERGPGRSTTRLPSVVRFVSPRGLPRGP